MRKPSGREIRFYAILAAILAGLAGLSWALTGDANLDGLVGPFVTASVVMGVIVMANRGTRPRFNNGQWFVIVLQLVPCALGTLLCLVLGVTFAVRGDQTRTLMSLLAVILLGLLTSVSWRLVKRLANMGPKPPDQLP